MVNSLLAGWWWHDSDLFFLDLRCAFVDISLTQTAETSIKKHPIPKLINTGAGDGVKILAGFSYFKEAWPQSGTRKVVFPSSPSHREYKVTAPNHGKMTLLLAWNEMSSKSMPFFPLEIYHGYTPVN